MTRNLRSGGAAIWLAALAACADDAPQQPPPVQVIPLPASVTAGSGRFRLGDGVRIVASDARAAKVAAYLADVLGRTRGIRTGTPDAGQTQGAIRLSLEPGTAASPESYRLEVAPDGVDIRAGDPRGLFYGAVTLWQLATADGAAAGPADIAAVRIEDAPRFAWRGLMLDSARHYQPPEFIKKLVDWIALHKLNVLHWHLTDDQGWRLQIRKYPRFTDVGAWRVPAGAAWPREPDPSTGRLPVYGGYYTQEQVRDIVAYAAERYVTIVPEIEMPGHAQAAIASYPQLGTGGTPPQVSPDWGVHDYLFNADESTITVLEDVLDEVVALFPGAYVHVGGDEAVKDRWRGSPRMQARIRELGLGDEEALQGWFVARIGRFLESRGRRLVGWDEILEGGVPAGATVMSWRGTEGAATAARAGHDVVMAPAPALYLDHLQGSAAAEPPGRPAVESLEDVYGYEPVPAGLTRSESSRILGAQLNAWTEHMRLTERVEHQAFPRVAALAEVTWSPAASRDWQRFQARLGAQFARYRALGIRYADSAFAPQISQTAAGDGRKARVTINKQASYGDIRVTRDGTDPGPASPDYGGAFEVALGTTIAASTFAGTQLLGGPVRVRAEPAAWQRRGGEALAQCTGNLVLRLEDDAPLDGARAIFNVDIVDPCWVWPDADLADGARLTASIGQLPFNFQIGRDVEAIRRGDARTAAGELEVRSGDCRGDPVAVIPLGRAAENPELSVIGPAPIPPQPAGSRLCLRFARPAIDPIWAIRWVELEGGTRE